MINQHSTTILITALMLVSMGIGFALKGGTSDYSKAFENAGGECNVLAGCRKQ